MTHFRGLGAGIVRLGEVIVIAAALGLGAIAVVGPLTGHQVIAMTSGSMGPDTRGRPDRRLADARGRSADR